jgi:gamma-glutamylcyclotransferase (GGCT)/AIG2-like uncharacterized protein YtfP
MSSPTPEPIRLFVYGTLRPGEAAHARLIARLPDARHVGPAITLPSYTLVNLGRFPALVAVGHTAVAGDLMAIPASDIGRLDDYEGPLYRRTRITLSDGASAEAYIAEVSDVAGSPVIRSGDWLLR